MYSFFFNFLASLKFLCLPQNIRAILKGERARHWELFEMQQRNSQNPLIVIHGEFMQGFGWKEMAHLS